MAELQGFYLEDLSLDQEASFSKTISEADIAMFAGVSGDTNPVHLDEEFASKTVFKGRVAHGMLSAGFISTILGTKLPGPGCIYLSQNLKFRAPVRAGDTVVATCRITAIDEAKGRVSLETECTVKGEAVISGEAQVLVPRRQG